MQHSNDSKQLFGALVTSLKLLPKWRAEYDAKTTLQNPRDRFLTYIRDNVQPSFSDVDFLNEIYNTAFSLGPLRPSNQVMFFIDKTSQSEFPTFCLDLNKLSHKVREYHNEETGEGFELPYEPTIEYQLNEQLRLKIMIDYGLRPYFKTQTDLSLGVFCAVIGFLFSLLIIFCGFVFLAANLLFMITTPATAALASQFFHAAEGLFLLHIGCKFYVASHDTMVRAYMDIYGNTFKTCPSNVSPSEDPQSIDELFAAEMVSRP